MSESQIQSFFKDLSEPRRSQFLQLHQFIQKHAPQLEPYMEGKFLGYGKYHYVYKSGREGEWFTIGLGNNKNSLAVYVVCSIDGQYLAEAYKDKLKAGIGKSCINFKKFEDIDLDVLGELIEKAAQLYQPEQRQQ